MDVSTQRNDAPTREFGRDPGSAVRGAVVLGLLGCGILVGAGRPLLNSTGFLRWVIPAGCVFVALLAGFGAIRAIQTAPRFRMTEEALEIECYLGGLRIEWSNLSAVGVTPGGSLGLRVADRDRLVELHSGSDEQREWLRTHEGRGEWDFIFPKSDLGHAPVDVAGWLESARTVNRATA